MRSTRLDTQWHDLMSLCQREKEYRAERSHPKLLRLVSKQIDEIAGAMGFSPRQIERREFRAERDGDHITRILRD
jgi:AraC-like DNA-binding protein